MFKKNLGKWLISWPPTVYLLIFFAVPALIMVGASFRFPGDYGGLLPLSHIDEASGRMVIDVSRANWHDFFTLDNYTRLGDDVVYLQLFIKSFCYAALTTLICLLMAYPLAWLIARSNQKIRDLLVLLVILPFWSNFLVRVYAWMIILGPNSAFTKVINLLLGLFGIAPQTFMFSPFAVIICLVYVHLPFMVLPLYANLEKHELSLLDAAQDLGANAWQRFWRVTWPLSLPGVYAGAALVFIPALGIFAVPDLLGGTDGIMIGNLIKQQFLESRDWPFGSVLSIVLTVFAIGLAGLAALIGRAATRGGDE